MLRDAREGDLDALFECQRQCRRTRDTEVLRECVNLLLDSRASHQIPISFSWVYQFSPGHTTEFSRKHIVIESQSYLSDAKLDLIMDMFEIEGDLRPAVEDIQSDHAQGSAIYHAAWAIYHLRRDDPKGMHIWKVFQNLERLGKLERMGQSYSTYRTETSYDQWMTTRIQELLRTLK